MLLLLGLCRCGEDPAPRPQSRPGPATPTLADPGVSWPFVQIELRADALVSPPGPGEAAQVLARRDPVRGSCFFAAAGGILRRGQGEASPAEKYGQLFLDPSRAAELAGWVRRNHGVEALNGPDAGICAGWANAAVAEEAPRRVTTVRRAGQGDRAYLLRCREVEAARPGSGCVRVTPADVLALLAEMYAAAPALVVGARCSDAQVGYNPAGQVRAGGCAGLDAGLFFLALTNYIGRQRRGLVLSFGDAQVAARPLLGYRVLAYGAAPPDQSLLGAGAGGQRRARFALILGGVDAAAPGRPGQDEIEYEILLALDDKGRVTRGAWAAGAPLPVATYLPTGPGTEAPGLAYRNVRLLLDATR